ncbi:DUF4337 domain-containing protein [Sphingobium sp. TKS]|uniref:DUF4337 domain-containing protein n=1 Tax=Sphingobium sp. TKS TaxID=1315974 RepID=UPI00076FF730|nr:DUF4337 domain-containing protein [Sphingobium sp. TKS]AMK25380.1 hypothetical protein K426_22364 [Sphingobium sp. TKS]
MELEVSAEAKDKTLNRRVAMTVVILSVAMGLCNIKDGNIVQAMQQAKADSVDRWSEYQATRTKWHIARTAQSEIALIFDGKTSPMAATTLVSLQGEIVKYQAAAPLLARQAQQFSDRYDALNVHDDQFDASDALISTAISIAAVAALAESSGALIAAWLFGAMGLFMGLCGFAGWAFHPDILSNLLG